MMQSYKYAVLGNPIEHSLSPVLHEAGYRAIGLDASYERIKVTKETLPATVQNLVEQKFNGWNVTYPLKGEIIQYLDEIDPRARLLGAVNTVKVSGKRLLGYNTDGPGLIRGLTSQGFSTKDKKVTIFGAGGAAKAVALALAETGAKVTVINRSFEKAQNLVELLLAQGYEAATLAIGQTTGNRLLTQCLAGTDIVVQATSVGLEKEKYPYPLHGLRAGTVAIDLIYNPPKTDFMIKSHLQGCEVLNGLSMLLYQGVLAWEIWLDACAPVSEMKTALYQSSIP
ncbi:MAG: shikimate dehydrogenase [Desulfotomaculaceae bacterium]|nr:shikimate dehydrogenase [Desulfotomaculaceae bacterium]